ncbi:MAG: DNA oxidative demethylase AlkB [Polyangiaceae bacterium]|nr:DNA oxidative demethylase AlkB [Polyangiaceae bacterium]MCW5790235.1 DNA oxidative demethylase AlkB [Polyangiaceae bacterium]
MSREPPLLLFEPEVIEGAPASGTLEPLGEQAFVLRGFALPSAPDLLAAIHEAQAAAPFRHLQTPGGLTMSVSMTSCGPLGWTSDPKGYRYTPFDPLTNKRWPPMPPSCLALAQAASRAASLGDFTPDACLINRYEPGARLSLHQDRDEASLDAPIVSISLGLPATFLFGGHARGDRQIRVPLYHGDVVVWGGVDRLRYHGVLPLKEGVHPVTGAFRYNLTLRRAG